MSNLSRAGLPFGAPRKRKEREESSSEPAREADEVKPPAFAQADGKLLLAGYMAHEFLAKGTLLGKKWEPVRANPVQAVNKPGSSKPGKPYVEVSALLMMPNGAHIPGVVNPTQLARWLQM